MFSYARLALVDRFLLASTGRLRHYSVRRQQTHKTFSKVLIANRGEIACRCKRGGVVYCTTTLKQRNLSVVVMRTCKEMGIKTVAIYSDADAQALHVRMADESVRVGPAVAADSYLKMEAILDAIASTEAQAVHPGYGFFSENKQFAEELEKRGVTFIGPNTHAIHVMGDKLESKRTAREAGVNTIPGFDGIVKDAEEAVVLASDIGYPVMLKASAGGGGKGMRIARNDAEVRQGFQLATEEAKAAVKDDRLLIEKFVDRSRHIEIQVLGDCHGNAIHLNERECSIQRRNQKVIEEAPSDPNYACGGDGCSTFLDPETRRVMGEQAVALAKAVQYNSAGTCEFLVDYQKNFYFLEMNTRLQVEHPVTELITGVDLVKEMIYSAAKYPLQWQQSDIGIDGWAVEARVYAEDPFRFLPSIGYLSTYREPTNIKGTVRVDTGIVEGSTISMYYDPMISKLVTHGRTREEALATMGKALDSYCIQGVKHNIPVLRDIITQPKFVSGDITTNFIPEVYPSGFTGRALSEDEMFELLAAAVFMYLKRENMSKKFLNQDSQHRLDESDVTQDLCVMLGEKAFQVQVPCGDMPTAGIHIKFGELQFLGGGTYTSTINRPRELVLSSDWCLGEPIMFASIDGRDVVVQYEGKNGLTLDLRHYGSKYSVAVQELSTAALVDHMLKGSSVDQVNSLLAPMPGVVKAIDCSVDDTVEEGTPLITLEAMKMQNLLPAPKSGKIKEILFKVGDSVGEDDVLMTFYP